MEAAVSLETLVKRFGAHPAVDGLSLVVRLIAAVLNGALAEVKRRFEVVSPTLRDICLASRLSFNVRR